MWLENIIMAQYLAQKYITNAKYRVHERNINTENKITNSHVNQNTVQNIH